MRKLKSQIIYSSVRVDTVLNSNKVHSGGNWHRTYKHLSHNKAVHVSSVQTWCLLSTEQVENTDSDLKTHTLSYTHENTLKFPLMITVCWEQYFLLTQIYGTPSVCFQLEVGKKIISIIKNTSYSLGLGNCDENSNLPLD